MTYLVAFPILAAIGYLIYKLYNGTKGSKQSLPAPITPQPMPSTVPPSHAPKIALADLCTAIRDYEGKPGDLNYLLNNPLDCRPSPVGYLPKYEPVEIIDTDNDPKYPYHVGKFARFKDYATGWEYGLNMVHFMIAAHPTWSFYDFFDHFAPSSDKNDPNKYAVSIATRCGLPPSTVLSTVLS